MTVIWIRRQPAETRAGTGLFENTSESEATLSIHAGQSSPLLLRPNTALPARNPQHPPHSSHTTLQTRLMPTALLPRKTLLRRRILGRPLSIVFPALDQRSREVEQINRNGGSAALEDDLGVDLRIQVRIYTPPNRMVDEDWRR